MIGLLHRRFSGNSSPTTLLKLYTSFVRPHLEYTSSVWNLFHKSEINNLKKVQRFAMRVCLKKWNLRSEELLTLTRLPTLQLRRLLKILHNLTNFPNNPTTKRNLMFSSRTVNCFSLVPYKCRTSLYKFPFFFPHAITHAVWNKLVSHKEFASVDCASILCSFKTYFCILT